jgi:predicted metalloendopeptidase
MPPTKKNKHHRAQKTKKHRTRDFYTVVNKKWLSHHKYVSNQKSSESNYDSLQKNVDKELSEILFKKIFKEKTPVAKRTKALYESILNWNDPLAETQINDCIFKLNYYRMKGTKDAMYEMLAWFFTTNVNIPIDFTVEVDDKIPEKMMLSFSEDGLVNSNTEFYTKKSHKAAVERKKYRWFINSVFSIARQPFVDVDKIFSIQKMLSKYRYKKPQPFDKKYNKFTIAELKRDFDFDIEKLTKPLGFIQAPQNINITNVAYYKDVMKLLNKHWASDEWYGFWVCSILMNFTRYHGGLCKVSDYYSDRKEKNTKRHTIALNKISYMMRIEMNKKYLEYCKNTKEIEYVKKLSEQLRNTTRAILLTNNWLTKKTTEMLLRKLDLMHFYIGYKPKWGRDPECDFKSDDGYGNYVKYLVWYFKDCSRRVYENPERDVDVFKHSSYLNLFTVNAVYSDNGNTLFIPNAFLQPPFVDLTKSAVYNYATIGFTIGHEIMHAFDPNGCKYNEFSERGDWWTKEDNELYKEKQMEIMSHYEKMAKSDNLKLDQKLKLDENFADIAGFFITEQSLMAHLTDMKIDKDEFDKQMKEFYIIYAKTEHHRFSNKMQDWLNKSDTHNLPKYRVNAVLSLSSNFRRIFNNLDEFANLAS